MQKVKQYFKEFFLSDLKAGFITSVVALPLAIGFAIASGVNPINGIYTAIIAGILGSLFGGSKFSITGPTGAMTVVILATLNKFGFEGLLIVGILAGLIQIFLGIIKVGKFVKFMPLPVISGFTAGIGLLIFIGQIPNALGIKIKSHEFVGETLLEIIYNLNKVSKTAITITTLTLLILIFLPKILNKSKYLKIIPASIIALITTTIIAVYINNPTVLPNIGTIPSGLPTFNFFKINIELIASVLPSAFTIALLGTIEALLCAVVCDGMTGTKHNSDKELISQGIVNTILPFFAGIPATAAVARSAVNIREGAKTRIAGIIHALFILTTLIFLAPLAQYIPKSFLAGILIFVSVKMINIEEMKTILHISKAETLVLFTTLGLTVLTDLVFAVQIGFVCAVFLLFIRLTNTITISHHKDIESNDIIRNKINTNKKLYDNVAVYNIEGPFFFGAMSIFDSKISEHLDVKMPHIILNLEKVPYIDSTAIVRLIEFIKHREKNDLKVYLSGTTNNVKKTLNKNKDFSALIKNNAVFFESTKHVLEHLEKSF
ncbi:SulP family inorganic anion transporter [Candidatus Woesearchaeota archaeon]|nr:SulP family inorganic anion transporter [Candidatus Woesearchaeota archaeon]